MLLSDVHRTALDKACTRVFERTGEKDVFTDDTVQVLVNRRRQVEIHFKQADESLFEVLLTRVRQLAYAHKLRASREPGETWLIRFTPIPINIGKAKQTS